MGQTLCQMYHPELGEVGEDMLSVTCSLNPHGSITAITHASRWVRFCKVTAREDFTGSGMIAQHTSHDQSLIQDLGSINSTCQVSNLEKFHLSENI